MMEENGMTNLIHSPTCFKSASGRCIDLIMTNSKNSCFCNNTFETGFSDFHHMVYTILKTTFERLPPKVVSYRCYRNFSEISFREELVRKMQLNPPKDYAGFENLYVTTLNSFAPKKSVSIRGNNKPHMSKELRNAIMKRSRLKNRANISRNDEDIRKYKIQRNLVVKMNRETKINFYKNLDPREIGNERAFWHTFKPLLSDKVKNTNPNIKLVENGCTVSKNEEIAECFNSCFAKITETLNIEKAPTTEIIEPAPRPIFEAIQKFKLHPSIIKIRQMTEESDVFQFRPFELAEVWDEINKLDSTKKTSGELPANILKLTSDLSFSVVTKFANEMVQQCIFPEKLKLADVSPVFKKGDATVKKNYRPISVLSSLSKVFERLLLKQIEPFIEKKLSAILCAFKKGHSTQHALFRVVEIVRHCIDKGGVTAMVLMDLSKAYDCLPHDLLIAKLEAYGLGIDSLKLIYSYITDRKQRVKIGSSLSDWKTLPKGVPQGSVLGPLLFNIFINDFFYVIAHSQVCNFADDNTVFACGETLEEVAISIENDMREAINWYKRNEMVANPETFQLIFFGLKEENELCIDIQGNIIKMSDTVKLLGVTIDSKLNFNGHINTICQKAKNKVRAFSRVARNLDSQKASLLYNSFIMTNFNYCPLIWMFSGKAANHEVNRVHKRALRVLLNDFDSSFEELLSRNEETTIHVRNLQKLMLEVYKCTTSGNPSFLWEFFNKKTLPYTLRTNNLLQLPKTRTNKYGNNSLSFRGSMVWNRLSDQYKAAKSNNEFKIKIKSWKGFGCNCCICN